MLCCAVCLQATPPSWASHCSALPLTSFSSYSTMCFTQAAAALSAPAAAAVRMAAAAPPSKSRSSNSNNSWAAAAPAQPAAAVAAGARWAGAWQLLQYVLPRGCGSRRAGARVGLAANGHALVVLCGVCMYVSRVVIKELKSCTRYLDAFPASF